MRTLLAISLAVTAACGSKASNEPPPAKPAHGAPIAFTATSVTPGADRGGEVAVKAYNFADKPVAQYMLLFRYTDAAGKVLKVKPGTPFEKDFDFMSLSGKRYTCAAKSWCSFKVDNLDIPAETKKAEVVAASVTALDKAGTGFEEEPLFKTSFMEWPGENKADEPPAPPAAP